MAKIDTVKVFGLIAILTAMASTMTFISADVFNSPITESLLVVLITLSIVTVSYYYEDDTLIFISQIIFTLSTIISSYYLLTTFFSGQLLISGFLALVTAILLVSIYAYQKEERYLNYERTKIIVVAILVLFIIVSVADLTTEVQTETNINNEIEVADSDFEEYSIGQVKIKGSVLPMTYESENEYSACLVNPDYSESEIDQENERIFEDPRFSRDKIDPIIFRADSGDKNTLFISRTDQLTTSNNFGLDLDGVPIEQKDDCNVESNKTKLIFTGDAK